MHNPDYRELVEYIAKHLVMNPDSVIVESSVDDHSEIKVMIRVAHDDIGRIIGKRGATINAIRLIAKASAVKVGDKVNVDIFEE
jgi:predicted RNA-binding protein YlqC (UPF0109 family)